MTDESREPEPKTVEQIMAELGVNATEARFIAALVAGKVKGDVIVVNALDAKGVRWQPNARPDDD